MGFYRYVQDCTALIVIYPKTVKSQLIDLNTKTLPGLDETSTVIICVMMT